MAKLEFQTNYFSVDGSLYPLNSCKGLVYGTLFEIREVNTNKIVVEKKPFDQYTDSTDSSYTSIGDLITDFANAFNSGGGGGTGGSVTIIGNSTDYSTATLQGTSNTLLNNIFNAIIAQKDGEFRIYTDPNDNDRFVGVSIDATDPLNPTYVYKYMDNGANYVGDVNDLRLVISTAESSIETILSEIRSKLNKKNNGYIFDLNTVKVGTDPFPSYPFILASFVISFDSGSTPYTKAVSFSSDAKKIGNTKEFIRILNESCSELIFESTSQSNEISFKSGNQSASDVVNIYFETDSGEPEFDVFSATSDDFNSSLDFIVEALQVIQGNTENLDYANWLTSKGRTMSLTYYTAVEAGNPSGSKNVKYTDFLIGTNRVLRKEISYDAEDDVVSITTI